MVGFEPTILAFQTRWIPRLSYILKWKQGLQTFCRADCATFWGHTFNNTFLTFLVERLGIEPRCRCRQRFSRAHYYHSRHLSNYKHIFKDLSQVFTCYLEEEVGFEPTSRLSERLSHFKCDAFYPLSHSSKLLALQLIPILKASFERICNIQIEFRQDLAIY